MLVMAVMGGLLCIIGLLLFADRNKGIGHYVKVVSYSLAFGMLFGGLGFNLLLNINDWLADKTPVRKEYRVTDINFLKRNKSWRKVPNYSLDCRIVETVCPDNFQVKYYFHMPINMQVTTGCTFFVTERNGIFGWKVVDGIEYDRNELFGR